MERARAWADEKENEKAEINRVDVKAMKWARVEAKARVREETNNVQRSVVEAAAKIRAKAEAERGNIKRVEDNARAKAEDEIRVKAEKTRKAREAKAKVEAETAERERVRMWAEAKYKEKADIVKLSGKARDKAEAEMRVGKKSNAARRVAEEDFYEIRVSVEVKRANRERV